jgi:hypothetical protein
LDELGVDSFDIKDLSIFGFEATTIAALRQATQSRHRRGVSSRFTLQVENWGRPSGGANFLLAKPDGGFSFAVMIGRLVWRLGHQTIEGKERTSPPAFQP